MKLASVQAGVVVRNTRNGSFYRFEKMEKGKARIWPLELFPTGLLISKPTPTLIDQEIEVEVVGPWHDRMVVEGKPSHSRRVYENELVKLRAKLVELQRDYANLPVGGKGKLSKGSWANKLKNVQMRMETLKLGLGFSGDDTAMRVPTVKVKHPFKLQGYVLTPSGGRGRVLAYRKVGSGTYATLQLADDVQVGVPVEILRPWETVGQCTY